MKDSDDTSYQECQDWTNTAGDCTNRLRVLGIFILFLCFVVIVKSGSMAENMDINKAKDGCYAIEKEAEYLEGVIPWYKYSGVEYKSEAEKYESMHEDIERCGEKYDGLSRRIICMLGVGVLVAIGLCPILILQ